MKRWFIIFALILGCVNPQTGKVDPYVTARSTISQAQIVVSLADGIFTQWAVAQTDQSKVTKATETYARAKTGVANGLRLALDGVNIAEAAKKDPNIESIGKYANAAWNDLYALLTGLIKKDGVQISVVGPATLPIPESSSGGIGKAAMALTISEPFATLPKILIQGQANAQATK